MNKHRHTGFALAVATLSTLLLLAGCNKPPPTTASATDTRSSASATPGQFSATPGQVSYTDVTEHVKMALQQNDALKGFDIAVVTLKGDVRLSGEVGTQAQIDEAMRIARAAEGAHTLHNELTLQR